MFALVLTLVTASGTVIHSVPGFTDHGAALDAGEKWLDVSAHRQGMSGTFIVARLGK